ncbi:hypothetical protein [Pseudoxanthomonas winnipegensis]|uniref:Uncharacterized protein n=1 Tax=Pseudoxanthomonas winnipegensis TaxID=2480810 RepID=A0A4Q8L4M6_9GAMM|nr:hypothetical protein [Pseudoxanthomonas winnipegensis]TAA19050.1 hypothetical protein EA660_20100 [Pseudoxanthomonas winnipegensis]
MATGLKCWDAAGQQTTNVTDRIPRVVGYQSIAASSSGSVSCPEGEPWYQLSLIGTADPGAPGGSPAPKVTISGQTISWGIPSGGSSTQAATLVFGVF